MSSVLQGNPDHWIPGLLEAGKIMLEELIPEAWPPCRAKFAGRICHEDKVTNEFARKLLESKRKRYPNFSFGIVAQYQVFPPTEDDTGKIDIAVLFGGDEELYLGYECKWLEKGESNKYDSGLVGEYLGNDGLGCFLTGKYALSMPVGYMVGYVASGDIASAEGKIIKRMDDRGLPQTFGHRGVRGVRVFSSSHGRSEKLSDVEITHILLAYQ